MTYTAHLSKNGAFYAKDGKPCTREEFEAALRAMAEAPAAAPDHSDEPWCEWQWNNKRTALVTDCGCLGQFERLPPDCPTCKRPISFKEGSE